MHAVLCLALALVGATADGDVDSDLTERPIRETRRLAAMGEFGWNSLAGLGINMTFHVTPHLSFDMGQGLGTSGFKTGLRMRGNLLTGNFTPFLGAGFIYGTGSRGSVANATADNNTFSYKILPSRFAQMVLGMEYLGDSGYTFLATAGYAKLLRSSNYEIVSGQPTVAQKDALDIVLGSGIVLSVAFGFTFSLGDLPAHNTGHAAD